MPFDACPETLETRPETLVARPGTVETAADRITQLALRAKSGDAKALDALLRALPPRLTTLVLAELKVQGRTLPAHEIEDVVEDVLVSAWRSDLARFDAARGTFLGFLRKRVSWRVGDAVRARGRSRTTPLEAREEEGFEVEAIGATPEERLDDDRRELRLLVLPGAVEDALAHMDDAAASRAVVAHDLEGRALREIADELSVHTSTACRARQRGIRWLAANLPAALREAA